MSKVVREKEHKAKKKKKKKYESVLLMQSTLNYS